MNIDDDTVSAADRFVALGRCLFRNPMKLRVPSDSCAEPFFRYEDGYSVFSGIHTSATHDISWMGFWYAGAGPRHLRHFLLAAGIDLTSGQIESRKSGESMDIRDGKPVIFRPWGAGG